MPLTRYELRNEYSLADPELYRAADKDDPEALLEGVAMAGLVGLLRQLGDLAEFAAEIFHNLHEEVSATSARGHGLALRLQQLEAEFPAVEKAFLSQTSHLLFLHNPGVEWHPNFRLDQSSITQGDLPRFVMDSYEECRGPPRLFLLDKFDTAGAGACLKRYTDPSFFRAKFTSSEAAKEVLRREKKARKNKKKGSRWKTGENAEVTASHSKLHQLLLEERCQSGSNVHTHQAKLKRRHSNNSLVNTTSGKSYMERFLSSRSPGRKFVSESSAIPSCSRMGLVRERKIQEKSPDREILIRDRSLLPSHSQEEEVLKPSLDDVEMDATEERNLNTLFEVEDKKEIDVNAKGNNETSAEVEDKKEIDVNAKGNNETSAEGYHSDEANSEIENFTDALATMDSEPETDTESKPKNELGFNTETKFMVSESNEEPKELQALPVDSHSVGSSLSSEDGKYSLEKRRHSSSYSNSRHNSAENMSSDGDLASAAHPFTVSKRNASVRTPAHAAQNGSKVFENPCYSPRFRDYEINAEDDVKHAMLNGSCNELSEVPSYPPSFRDYEIHAEDASKNDSVASLGASRNEDQTSNLSSVIISSNGDSGSGQLSPKSENDVRQDFLSVGSSESQTIAMLDTENLDALWDTSRHLSNNSSPTTRERDGDVDDDDDIEETTAAVADDSHNETKMNGKLCSPDSVLLSSETELYGLVEQELEVEARSGFPANGDINDVRPSATVTDLDKVLPGERSEFITSVVNSSETDEFRETNDSKITDRTPLHELDMEEVSNGDSEVETSCKTMGFNKSEHDTRDGDAEISVSAAEAPLQVAAPETIDFCSKDRENTGDFNQEKLEISDGSDANILAINYTKNEMEDQSLAAHSDYDTELGPSGHGISDDACDPLMVESTQTQGTEDVSSKKETDQREELDEPLKTDSLEGQRLHAFQDNLTSWLPNGDSTRYSDHVCELAESPNHMYLDGVIPPPTSSPGTLRQPDNSVMQDSMDAMPPLPPLPPMQWRIGKLRHDSSTSSGETVLPSFNSSSLFSAPTMDLIDQQGFPTFHGGLAQPMNPFLQYPTSDAKTLVHPSLRPLSPVVNPQNPFLTDKELQRDSGEVAEHSRVTSSKAPSATDILSIQSVPSTSPDELQESLDSLDDEMHGHETQNLEGELKWQSKSSADIPKERSMQPHISTAPTTHTVEGESNAAGDVSTERSTRSWYETHTVEGELVWESTSTADIPSIEYGKPNGSLKSRLLSRPRSPLIEAVASHDKSNLRKVAERIIPESAVQVDERNSLLEQIRAKSFSLKPAVATRPRVQGPKTNLKVVAILEKANAIRQALAGSDDDEDDDEDSWSE